MISVCLFTTTLLSFKNHTAERILMPIFSQTKYTIHETRPQPPSLINLLGVEVAVIKKAALPGRGLATALRLGLTSALALIG